MTNASDALIDILEYITDIVTSASTWIGNFITCIVSNPILLLFVIVAFVGLGVGLLSRLMHL